MFVTALFCVRASNDEALALALIGVAFMLVTLGWSIAHRRMHPRVY